MYASEMSIHVRCITRLVEDAGRKLGIKDLIVTEGVVIGRASVVVRRASVREGLEVLSHEE